MIYYKSTSGLVILGADVLFENTYFGVQENSRMALVGRNWFAGKSPFIENDDC